MPDEPLSEREHQLAKEASEWKVTAKLIGEENAILHAAVREAVKRLDAVLASPPLDGASTGEIASIRDLLSAALPKEEK